MCDFFSGWLFDEFPKPSKSALTVTPCLTFSASISKSRSAIESLRKLKYSRWTVSRACLMALNMSSNFSCPDISSVTELSCEKVTPCASICLTISESARSSVCADNVLLRKAASPITIDFLPKNILYSSTI